MSEDFPSSYDPKNVEENCYQMWEENGFFHVDPHSEKPPYCIILPPPNVTGALHMGHALVDTVQDVLIRWKRMQGFEALWMPGVDHAGISTQTVVERHLIKTLGKRRKDFSREEFLSHVWQWKELNEKRIITQLKKVGCSCDWSRKRFTMDEVSNKAVRKIFKKMYDQNLIYRGDYLVNWDPVTQTALADDEVEYEEKESSLWYFKYPLEDGSDYITIATTRPETMLGDTAVAVSPKDERYKHLIGKNILLPITNRSIPIIKDHYVDPEFGTGAVKITPAHDPNDYEIGINHKLEMINIMTPDGKINEISEEFKGLSMSDARQAVVKKMQELGLVKKIEPYTLRVGISYRSKAIIEPYLSKQWFVRMEPFKEKLMRSIEDKNIKMVPKSFESTYFHWISNLRDWCISRQLWWGHQIPIWYHKDDPEKILCYDGEDLPEEVQKAPNDWRRDEDVLDTWFSSALWPFSTLGWPDNTQELQKFYPTSVLVTGHDILFFWVARMILMGEFALQEKPFAETFLHGLIYGKSYWKVDDEGNIHYLSLEERLDYDMGKPLPKDIHSKWEKMSKSKGNVIDPLEIIDSYGADAMRMALLSSLTHARQIDLDRRRFEEFKNFANKFWNSARFVFMNLDAQNDLEALTAEKLSEGLDLKTLRIEDQWILSKYNNTIQSVEKHLSVYEFDKATQCVYSFYWDEFCAYFVEVSKPYLFGKVLSKKERETKQKLLAIILLGSVRLLHPFVPFITEQVFQMLKKRFFGLSLKENLDPYSKDFIESLSKEACIVSLFPKALKTDISEEKEKDFELISKCLYQIRNIRADMGLPPSTACDVYFILSKDSPISRILQENSHLISSLVKIKEFYFVDKEPDLKLISTGLVENIKIIIPLPEDMKEKEIKRLQTQIEKFSVQIEGLKTKLSNSNFIEKAPEELVKKTRESLENETKKLEELKHKLELLKA